MHKIKTLNRYSTSIFAIFICFNLLSCANFDQNYIEGTWVVKDESRKYFFDSQKQAKATIVFDSSGKFSIYEVPADMVYSKSIAKDHLVTGSGMYYISAKSHHIVLNFDEITLNGKATAPFSTNIFISRFWSGVYIYFFQGDVDGMLILFEKSKER